MIEIPKKLAEASPDETLRGIGKRGYGESVRITSEELTDDLLEAARAASVEWGDKALTRVFVAIQAARAGDFNKTIPRLQAAPEVLLAYLRANLVDGWLYRRGPDGSLQPWLVTDIKYDAGSSRNDDKPSVRMTLVANGRPSHSGRGEALLGPTTHSVTWWADNVLRKHASQVLEDGGYLVETPDLRAAYEEGLARYVEVLQGGFGEQYRFTGTIMGRRGYQYDRPTEYQGRRVVHDIHRSQIEASGTYAQSAVLVPVGKAAPKVEGKQRKAGLVDDADAAEYGIGAVPTHFALLVFDLGSHEHYWVSTDDVERYEYDPTLVDKIVLPQDQRNLLEILTTNIGDFTGDVVEGKSAGNVILAKGEPGVGKTLTAEVYSEAIGRPLYSIHSGNLGIKADDIRKNLEVVFQRVKRWRAVLLLDEADVFVLERGDNLEQNAIVAEFLRTLEYFDGLMFMTTNRADNIDDAILSRAAAIIDYRVPSKRQIREVWLVQAANQGYEFPEELLDAVCDGFAKITPRDVKMLLRLVLRVAKGNGVEPGVETFERCAMFRGLHFDLEDPRKY